MFKMTIVQLGVILFAICLSTQVVSQSSTKSTGMGNSSTSNPNATTMATYAHSTANATSPTGSGVSLHAGAATFLIPVIMAATSFLQRNC